MRQSFAYCLQAVDDYAVLILKEDEDSKAYDDALSAVGTYLEQRDENVLNDAKTKVRETKESMEEASERIASYEMEDPFEELLTEYQIAPEEYLMFADERKEELYDYIHTLRTFEEYFENGKTDPDSLEELRKEHEMAIRMQDIMRSYQYCGINYWFAGWEDEAVDYVRKEVHEKLVSFSAEGEPWQDTRQAVEQRMTFYLNQLEDLTNEWAEYLGERQEELYQKQQ